MLKRQKRPCLLHCSPRRERALSRPCKAEEIPWSRPTILRRGETKPAGTPTYSEVSPITLNKLADRDPNIVAITAAMPNGNRARPLPGQSIRKIFRCGIAETRCALCRGLGRQGTEARCGHLFHLSAARFDPIVHDVCLQNLPVVFCMDRGSLSGDDGPTHHASSDIIICAEIPTSCTWFQGRRRTCGHLYTATLHNGPIAIRYPSAAPVWAWK